MIDFADPEVAKLVKSFGSNRPNAERLDDIRYKVSAIRLASFRYK